MAIDYVVLVLAGGDSTRYGSDKMAVLLDRSLAGMAADAQVICVGPYRLTDRPSVRWVREEPPGGGPLAALAAGLAIAEAEIVVLVGGDMPDVGLAVSALVECVQSNGRSAVLVDDAGRSQPLASAWPRLLLVELLGQLVPLEGRPIRLILENSESTEVPDRWGAARDVDFPPEVGN